jgi:hypothetical protein
VTDVQELAGALAKMATAGRRSFTFEEILAAGRPAMYRKFGDHLLFLGGRVFDVREPGAPIEVGVAARPEERAPVAVDRALTVGIEYGWRHASDCPCSYCKGSREAA